MSHHPVILFVYKRPDHTKRTLEALARCEGAQETSLVVYSDGPKIETDRVAVDEVRNLIRFARGFRSVRCVEASHNQGLAKSVIAGVSQVLDEAEACIVVEDDLNLAPSFLTFLNSALDRYRSDRHVFSLSGYGPPPRRVPAGDPGEVWFAPRPCSWGWAIWKDRWQKVDWDLSDREAFFSDPEARRCFESGGRDLSYFLRLQLKGELDSWAVRMAWSQSRVGGLTLYPARSFVDNRGLDGSGTHSRAEGDQEIVLGEATIPMRWPEPFDPSAQLLKRFRRHYEGSWTERWAIRVEKVMRFLRGAG